MDRTDAASIFVGAAVFFADQVIKYFIQGTSLSLFPGVSFYHVINTGGSFGMLQGYNALFVFLTVVVLGLILLYRDELSSWSLSLIVSGGVSNLVDRVIRGHVVDYIDVWRWPVFNLADAAISVGVATALVYAYREENGQSQKRDD